MKRPSFQFYTGDWRKNAKLRRCTPAARGVWVDVLCLFHDSEDEYGILRWPLKDIANAAGAAMTLVRELVDKGVLKGSDKDAPAYVYRPKHAGKVGEPVILVIADGGPVWYSSRMVRDEWVRQKRGGSTRFDTDNQPDSRSPKVGIGEPVGDGPSSSSSPSGSVPKGTGGTNAPPPVDNSKTEENSERRRLWREGGALLVDGGMDTRDARSLLGRLAKDFPTVIREAVDASVKAAPADPKSYLVAECQRLTRELVPSNTVASESTADYLARVAKEAATEADRKLATPEEIAAIKAQRTAEATS